MSELYMMVTITNRQLTRKFVECYKENGAQVGSVTVGMGTAANEIFRTGRHGEERIVPSRHRCFLAADQGCSA